MSGSPILKLPRTIPGISLRPARREDYAFAAELYLASTKRLLSALGRWDEGRVVTRFKGAFKIDHAQVIRLDGADIGWMQVSDSADRLHLHQLHIVPRFHNRGIGTCLIQALLERARGLGRPVALNVIRGNPALSLYQRLGFRIVGGDVEKLHMRWDAEPHHRC